MTSVEDITKTVHRYLETLSQGRPDDIAALYAEDATVEDPVGGEVHIGR
ncbi:MAG TPA: nuclear transport factor 2 family protein, partial [Mycobacterium sp.]|nr:nuclear transport factor 2 family protein [Mycobacterium sp.]